MMPQRRLPLIEDRSKPETQQIEVITDWYKHYVRPERVGEYEISTDPRIMPISKGHWNGVLWCDVLSGKPFSIQDWQWRGLAEPINT